MPGSHPHKSASSAFLQAYPSSRIMTSPSSARQAINALQKKVWDGSIPLEIRLSPSECRSYDQSDPYLVRHVHWGDVRPIARRLMRPSIDSMSPNSLLAISITATPRVLQDIPDRAGRKATRRLVRVRGCPAQMALPSWLAVRPVCRYRTRPRRP